MTTEIVLWNAAHDVFTLNIYFTSAERQFVFWNWV